MKVLAFILATLIAGTLADTTLPERKLKEHITGPTLQQHGREEEITRLEADEDKGMRRVWIRYKKGDHDAAVRAAHRLDKDHKMKIKHDFPHTDSIVITATEEEIQALANDPAVQSIADDPKRFLHVERGLRSHQRNLLEWQGQARNYGVSLVQADQTWDVGLTGAGVKVCIIDTGFDVGHEDFDQSHITGESLVFGSDWDYDYSGHGTHLAGIIASQNDEIGLVGVAPEALVHFVRVYDDEDWFVYTSALVDAAYLCRDAGAKIISMSMGGDWPLDEEEEIFTELYNENGILSIASSGNWGDSSYSYPASYENVLSVGALTRLEETAWFSQYNDKVDLTAPGFDIWSTIPDNYECDVCAELVCKGYASLDGTSMSVPFVAGVAALLWSHDTSVDVSHIYNALLAGAIDFHDLGTPGYDEHYGWGMVAAFDSYDILQKTLSGEQALRTFDPSDPRCSDGEMLVRVDVKTDRYGNETCWGIYRDVDDFMVMAGSGFSSRSLYDSRHCLPKNKYTLRVDDAFGDGICCDYGDGFVKLFVDWQELGNITEFTDSETISFGDEEVPIPDDPKPDLPPFQELTFELMTDWYPYELSLKLTDTSTGQEYWDDLQFNEGQTLYSETIEIDATVCYLFELFDSFGDGICCDGSGFLKLLLEGEEILYADEFGSYVNADVGDC